MSNHTKFWLGIEDNNLMIIDYETSNDGVTRFNGILDYQPKACPNCGIKHEGQIIKYGWRQTTIRYPKVLGKNIILSLKRRYFKCNECQSYFLAQTSAVPKNCTISNTSRKLCLTKLTEPVSLTHIADEISTSDSFVGRILMASERDFKPNYKFLPNVLLLDEVKSTKSATDAMSFEFMDASNHELIDFLSCRRLYQIQRYFYRYSATARKNVKIIVTDMNYTYPKLAKEIFPNAIVIIDKFHIINSVNRGFTKTRIKLMKELPTSSQDYKALKRYWKLLLKPAENLDYKNFKKWTYFPYLTTEIDIIDHLLSLNPELKKAYELMNQIRSALHLKDWKSYDSAIKNTEGCSEEMTKSIETLFLHHFEIKNTFNHHYSNGPLEGTNNKIKVIKRVSFSFRNFYRFRIRIFYTLKIHTKKGLITK
ncbi:ISL3 family transposase [Dellaglioa sp. L3N]